MIIGFAWKDVPVEDRTDIINEFKGAGFVASKDFGGGFPDGPRDYKLEAPPHIGDDMVIIDAQRKIFWTGDWGSKTDMQVDIRFAHTINFQNFN